jgi:aspartate/methionine/tyrosine aminotransferase
VSTDTFWLVTRVFQDFEFCKTFIATFQDKVRAAERISVEILERGGVTVKTASNGYFVLLDLTDIAGSEEKEREVTFTMIDQYQVNVAPAGLGFKYPIWGWFRLCFACPEAELRDGLGRVLTAVAALRGQS